LTIFDFYILIAITGGIITFILVRKIQEYWIFDKALSQWLFKKIIKR